ncbi:MAG TPA: glycosyltransferase family 4 protein [Acetobacteraceae bacterium]|nr:glycosyltransferase family 4 protein [Acetobacteraceae bacterium]
MRILVIAHGHPDLSTGGGEIAAYRQAQELRRQGHATLFLARAPTGASRAGTPFSVRAGQPDDVLFHSPAFDRFLNSQRTKWALHEEFRSLLESFRPDAVHLHHYMHLGLEFIREARKYSATLPIVMTLHEYMAICDHDGQMVKTDGRLCEASSPLDCHLCFPDKAPQEFFLREQFHKSYFALVDRFVCPSRFLLERYAAWGIERAKLLCIENGQHLPPAAPAPDTDEAAAAASLCRRFGFFGQISRLKGIDLLFDAIGMLDPATAGTPGFRIHGSLQWQTDAFRAAFADRLATLGGRVAFGGPYRAQDVGALMREVGWVVVPSIWWENSPLVIQEAFAHGRPVIVADIGGMAEKVQERVNGLHFRARSAAHLARVLAEAADPALWSACRRRIEPPPSIEAATGTHLALYAQIAAEREPLPATAARPARKGGRAVRA